ncbi:MAG: hypothetical protein ACFCUU_04375 [Cyclobacteriaceae bacterium]
MSIASRINGRTIQVQGEEFLFCSGTAYLGIPYTSAFNQYFNEGIARYGTGYSASPGGNIRLEVYERAAHLLTQWTGATQCLTFSSGMMAGQCLIKTLAEDSAFFYLKGAHPAMWHTANAPKSYDLETGLAQLQQDIDACTERKITILASTVDALTPLIFDFSPLKKLKISSEVSFVIDDSHGIGLLGSNGGGRYREIESMFPNWNVILTSSLGKAPGISAGMVGGKLALIESLQKSPIYRGGSPALPATLHAFVHCWPDLFTYQLEVLNQNTALLNGYSHASKIFYTVDGFPVFRAKSPDLYEYLKRKGIWLSSFPYPDIDGDLVTRLVVNALLTDQDFDRIFSALEGWVRSGE